LNRLAPGEIRPLMRREIINGQARRRSSGEPVRAGEKKARRLPPLSRLAVYGFLPQWGLTHSKHLPITAEEIYLALSEKRMEF
jgi:hypothetical protein